MRLLATVVLVLCSACIPKRIEWREVNARADHSTLRHTPAGDVIGFVEQDGTLAWVGIPYAQPPVGALRWKAPKPAAKFDGGLAFSATKYGPQCPQLDADGVFSGEEACLTLNISARSIDDAKRPVMVWVHGGGNTVGTANSYAAMRNIARRYGVVLVSVNYRLGLLGWFRHPSLTSALDSADDASGNYGTLDVIEALRWVRTNIAGYGGDPSNVTVFGESAGGFNIFALLTSPLASGLFHRAAIQSGLPSTNTIAEATNFIDDLEPGAQNSSNEVLLQQLLLDGKATDRGAAKSVLATLNANDVANYLRARTPEQLLAPLKGAPIGMYSAPQLFREGHVLPTSTITEALAQGVRVPVLIGFNRDEYKRFALGDPHSVSRFLGFHVKHDATFERDMAYVSALWKELGVDAPTEALRHAGTPTFTYRFDWDEEPKTVFAELPKLLGAAHGLDVGFVMGDEVGELDFFHLYTPENEKGRVKLSRTMMSYWVQFATSGAPSRGVDGSQPAWEHSGFIVFDTDEGGGVRMAQGRETLDAIETRLWSDAAFTNDAERCETAYTLFKVMGGAAGAWSTERAERYSKRCTTTH